MLLLTNQFHDLFDCLSVIVFLCPIRGQHFSRCFREEFTLDLDCSPRTSLAREVELPSRRVFSFSVEMSPQSYGTMF